MWDYAKLSQLAKAKGGPDELIKTLIQRGIEIGTKKSQGKVGVALLGGAFLGTGITLIIQTLINRKPYVSEEESNAAAQELINGINEYDRELENNPDIESLPEITKEEADAEILEYVESLTTNTINKLDGGVIHG